MDGFKEPISRDNYKKWPTASLVLTGLSCGSIFVAASNPLEIAEAKNEHLALQIMFMLLGLVTLIPSLFILYVFGTFFIMKMAGVKIPRWVLKRFPFLQPFYEEAKKGDDEDSFLEIENKRREIIGDTMLELDNSSSQSTSDDGEGLSEIWTTYNHKINDPRYKAKMANALREYKPNESPPEVIRSPDFYRDIPRIVVDSSSERFVGYR